MSSKNAAVWVDSIGGMVAGIARTGAEIAAPGWGEVVGTMLSGAVSLISDIIRASSDPIVAIETWNSVLPSKVRIDAEMDAEAQQRIRKGQLGQ